LLGDLWPPLRRAREEGGARITPLRCGSLIAQPVARMAQLQARRRLPAKLFRDLYRDAAQ